MNQYIFLVKEEFFAKKIKKEKMLLNRKYKLGQ